MSLVAGYVAQNQRQTRALRAPSRNSGSILQPELSFRIDRYSCLNSGAGYSARVLEEIARRFPGQKITAVISTSDSRPHFGGLREYVARGVPAYILDLNEPIITRFLAAPLSPSRTSLAQHPRQAGLQIVHAKVTLGSGPNRLEIVPYRTQNGERMMMVYFPELRLLYGSDMTQPFSDVDFGYGYYDEVRGAVAREGWAPERVFGMHIGPMPWSEVQQRLAKYVSNGAG